MRRIALNCVALASLLAGLSTPAGAQEGTEKAIAPVEPKLGRAVDFERDIYPILDAKCLACHNVAINENGLVLEDVKSILKGGKRGSSVVAKEPEKSLLYTLSSRGTGPAMPPLPNKVEAAAVTPEELGLIRQWILEGASAGMGTGGTAINWQPLPRGINPIYAAAVSHDGQYAVAGRANKVVLYHIPSGDLVAELADPALASIEFNGKPMYEPGSSHRDFVHSLAISPSGHMIASGSYREVKLWARPDNWQRLNIAASGAAVPALAVSGDNKWIAAASADNTIKLFQFADGQPGKVLTGHAGVVTGLAFSADGTTLYSGSQDKTIRAWNVAEGTPTGSVDAAAAVNSVALTPDSARLIAGCADNQIRVFLAPALTLEKAIMGHGGPVTSVAVVLPQGTRIASGSEDGTLRIWELANGQQVASLAQGGPVTAIAVSPTGTRYASAGANQLAILWDAANNQQVAQMKGDKRAARTVYHLEADDNEAKATLSAATNAVPAAEKSLTERTEAQKKATEAKAAAEKKVADTAAEAKAKVDAKAVADKAFTEADALAKAAVEEKAKAEKAVTDADAGQKAAVAAQAKANDELNKDPNNDALKKAKADADAAVVKAGEGLKAAQDAKAAAEKKVTDTAAALKAAQDAKTAADKAATDAQANAKKAEDEKNSSVKALEQADKAIREGTEAVAKAKVDLEKSTAAQKVTEAALAAGRQQNTDREKPVRAIAFSRDGKELALGNDLGQVCTFDGVSGQPLEVLEAHKSPVRSLAYATGRSLVSGGDDQAARVWDLNPAWKLVGVLGPKKETPGDLGNSVIVSRVLSLDFSHDGKLLATGGGDPSRSGELMIWDVASQTLVKNLESAHSDTVFGLEFSRDDKQILSGAADKFVKIHDVATGKLVRSFEGHTNHVLDVTWRADMKQVASAGADNAIKVWSVETGEQQRTIGGYAKQVTAIQYMGRGNNFVSCGGDKTVRFHTADNGNNFRNFAGAVDFMFVAAGSERESVVVAGGQDGVLRVWNGANGQVLRSFEPPKAPQEQAQAK